MRFLYRLITPIVALLIALLSAMEGNYIIALSASIILGLICYNLMDVTDPARIPSPPLPELIAQGPCHVHFNNIAYPDWVQTEDGFYYTYYGVDVSNEYPNRVDSDGLVYRGVRYLAAGSCEPNLA
ncbi:hypothetical protein [Parendozoicomonas sp. Alg238-R29]|uniref:hypothetical protein n=1 Tax=Parendozoicomonas sp. Alg238-R29 TaxID=2993446 RepID=UPI00248E583B|nr:hypothetical protein [Parendozoicomonas sp. Alg238-R29]